MAKILILDDHQIYLDGLELTLTQNLPDLYVFKSQNLDAAIDVLRKDPNIDLILLDLDLSDSSGLEAWEQLKLSFGPLPVAVLSASDRIPDIRQAKDAGALGFINKALDNHQLIQAIQHILEGRLYFPQGISDTPDIRLTPRQKDVLSLLAEGLPNKTICKQLDMSEATVKTHLRTLFTLFNVNTRTQCVSVATKLQLIG